MVYIIRLDKDEGGSVPKNAWRSAEDSNWVRAFPKNKRKNESK